MKLTREEIIINIIAAQFDMPSVFMDGPSKRAKRKAEDVIYSLKLCGFRIEGDYNKIVDPMAGDKAWEAEMAAQIPASAVGR